MVLEGSKNSKVTPAASTAEEARQVTRACASPHCVAAALATLQEQWWCVEHFLVQSYQGLERLEESTRRTGTFRDAARAEARAFLDECSLQTLNICLCSPALSNLERGRLLDVLLWTGELSEVLRVPVANVLRRAASQSGTSTST
jgi:hypothetical protein